VECSDSVTFNRDNLGKVLGFGFCTGSLSGFFRIGGRFLIVPALKASTAMGVHRAIGASLVAVAAFGIATAASYAASGLIDWPLAGTFVLGGAAGSFAGTAASRRLAAQKGRLNTLFAALIFAVALYMAVRSVMALAG